VLATWGGVDSRSLSAIGADAGASCKIRLAPKASVLPIAVHSYLFDHRSLARRCRAGLGQRYGHALSALASASFRPACDR